MTPEPEYIVVGPSGKTDFQHLDKTEAEERAGSLRQQFETDGFVAKPVGDVQERVAPKSQTKPS